MVEPDGKPSVIAFVINSLEGGGAERVFSTFIQQLTDSDGRFDGAEVHVVLLDKLEERYSIDAPVVRHTLDCGGATLKSVRRLRSLFKEIRPEIAVSFLTRANVATVAASRKIGCRSVISERVNTSSHFGSGLGGQAGRFVVRRSYPKADAVIAVSGGVRDDLATNYGVSVDRIGVIHNPYDIDRILRLGAEEPEIALPDDFVVAIGRLTENKNFSMLIEAFARSGLPASLVILGEGEDREKLAALAASEGLADRVLMPGFVSNPYAVVSRARFYAASSNAEGFPNAMAEAMALGCGVVATDCPSGPAELLGGTAHEPGIAVDAPHGIIVPVNDAPAMAAGMTMMFDPGVAKLYEKKGRERIEDFRVERISGQFADFIRRARTSA